MKWLIFSKNRTYQLDAFLRTARDNAKILLSNVTVLYKYDELHNKQLLSLIKEYKEVKFIEEFDFRKQVIDWCQNSHGLISFATDDALFTREINENVISSVMNQVTHVLTFSLRMGLHLNHCYPSNSHQNLPNGEINSGVFFWSWIQGDGDWGYPLSVDGHVFRNEEISSMLNLIDFNNPNTLEANLQILKNKFYSHIIACHPVSCYFNSPLNVV
jgi:hypothetical protein